MLLRFECENIFCFDEPCALTPIANSDKRHPSHLSEINRVGAPKGLRLAAIYGPNGHGKTRFIDALFIVEQVVLGEGENALSHIRPFLFKAANKKKPSKFSVHFRIDDIDYEYGLVATSDEIIQEWLFETEKRVEVPLFSRWKEKGKYRYEFGSKLRRSKSPTRGVDTEDVLKVISSGLSKSESFLYEAVKRDVNRLSRAFSWFSTKLMLVGAESNYSRLHEHAAENDSFLDVFNSYLNEAGTGISGLVLESEDVPIANLSRVMPMAPEEALEEVKNLKEGEAVRLHPYGEDPRIIKRKQKCFEVQRVFAKHSTNDGSVNFALSSESAGTQRLIDLIPIIHLANKKDVVFIVDELDRKLHPLLAYDFVRKFLEEAKGQLIFTTHTTQLLDLDLVRRDEVWLFNKKKDGSSELYSLDDFSIRPDLDIRKGYLAGRFGAIPFSDDLRRLGWIEHVH